MIPPAELEYVSDRDGGFKQTLEKCKLLTRCAFEYSDQTGTDGLEERSARELLWQTL